MSCSEAGILKVPGRHVRAKAGLNKSILDQGRYESGNGWPANRRGWVINRMLYCRLTVG